MVSKTANIKDIILRYRNELGSQNIRVKSVYLYGSYAHGKSREGSDIDIIVVSPDFAKLNKRQRLELLGITSARIMEPVQAYGFTPAEIEKRLISPFWEEVLENEAIAV